MRAPNLTKMQVRVLEQLAEAGVGVAVLMRVSPKTRRVLCRHDWAVYSWKLGESLTLTGRGLEVLKAWYGRIRRAKDGLCPRCRTAPKVHNYCKPCSLARKRERYATKGYGYRSDTPCKCGKARYISATGLVYGACKECLRRRVRQTQLKRGIQLKALAEAGTPALCRCGGVLYVAPSGLASSQCRECLRRASNLSYLKRAYKKAHSSKQKGANKHG